MSPTHVTDKLGETRVIDNPFPDGSFNCPFCWAAVFPPDVECSNPGCLASKYMTPDLAVKLKAKYDKERQEREERERNHKWAMERIERDNRERRETYDKGLAEVHEANQCVRCFAHNGKRIRHRAECPRDRKAIYESLGLTKVRGNNGGTYYE